MQSKFIWELLTKINKNPEAGKRTKSISETTNDKGNDKSNLESEHMWRRKPKKQANKWYEETVNNSREPGGWYSSWYISDVSRINGQNRWFCNWFDQCQSGHVKVSKSRCRRSISGFDDPEVHDIIKAADLAVDEKSFEQEQQSKTYCEAQD